MNHPTPDDAILELDRVSKSFDGTAALTKVVVAFESGTITALVGPNGAGKTTLFNVCSGFLQADLGIVRFGKKDITRRSPDAIARMGLARTFQTPRVFYNLTVLQNTIIPLQRSAQESLSYALNPFVRHSDEPLEAKAQGLLGRFDLHSLSGQCAYELSYGQLKILQLVRTVLLSPQVLLLDEPTAGLFPELRSRVLGFLKELVAEGQTVVLIEHNLETVREVAARTVVMNHGEIMAEGPTDDVLARRQVRDLFRGSNDNANS